MRSGAGTAASLLLFLLAPSWAAAHPYDEVIQGAYLTLAPGELRLELDLTPGPAVAETIIRPLDPKGDKRITDAEARAYALSVLKQSSLKLDGVPALWRIDRVSIPAYDDLRLAADTVKVYAIAARPDRPGGHVLIYDNRYQPAKSQCIANIFLQPGGGWRYQVAGQKHSDDGRTLTVNYTDSR